MRIAIVDDNEPDRRELLARVEAALAHRGRKATALEYGDGTAFLAAAREGAFDLAFLDIYMEGLDGVAAARELRRFDSNCVLVFTTTSPDHALEGYRVRALQYLVKPYAAAEVERIFDELDRRLPAPERVLQLQTGRQTVSLRASGILWAEHYQHQVHIHTRGGETVCRMTFRGFSDLLENDRRFFVCGRGVLVNLTHAADFDGATFTLNNGDTVPVSRSVAEEARRAFAGYLFEKE